jgi:drug/metabolite transporter (DMT)-like permease
LVPPRAGAAIVYLGFFGSVIGFALYYYVIKHLEASKVALITLLTPVIALLLGNLLNGETIGLRLWLGTALILCGLTVHQWDALAAMLHPPRRAAR